eukprot:5648675-Amphidinium_carterae.1
MLCGVVNNRTPSRESRVSSSQPMSGDATPFFGNGGALDSHDDAWKVDLKSIVEQVVYAEHQLTRQSISRMQSTLDNVLAASECGSVMEMVTSGESFAPDAE